MAKRVGIVAVAQTQYAKERRDVNQVELGYEVVRQVMEETGLKWSEDGKGIDGSVMVCDEFWEARTLSEIPYGDIIAAHMRDSIKVPQDGTQALIYAAATILSGHMDTILLLAACKESQIRSPNIITNYGFDPIFQRKLGLDDLLAAALQAKRYMHQYGITREQCAKVVVKNRGNGKANPVFRACGDLTVEDVLSSMMLAPPISELDKAPVSDGACAMILTTEEKAKKLTGKPVWITGFGSSRDVHNLGNRDLADCASLTAAAGRAYRMAGIADPKKEIDLFEISERYSYQELLWSEGLGLCEKGKGGKLMDSGVTGKKGSIPINPSGGVLCGIPTLVAGMSRVAEAVLQLTGSAGAHQAPDANTALAHGITGPCGQLHSVITLANR